MIAATRCVCCGNVVLKKDVDPITGFGPCCPTRTRKIRADKKTGGGENDQKDAQNLGSQVQEGEAGPVSLKFPKQLKLGFL